MCLLDTFFIDGLVQETHNSSVLAMELILVAVNFILNSQYKNVILTLPNTTLSIAAQGHPRSPWTYQAGTSLKSSHIHEATQIWAGEAWNNETRLTTKVQNDDTSFFKSCKEISYWLGLENYISN